MINRLEKPPLDELIHFGVLGMKWGKHKKSESAQIQEARSAIRDTKQKLKLEKKKMNIETGYGVISPSAATLKRVERAAKEVDYAKQDLSNAKILERLKESKKSKAQISMENKYKQKGMSDAEAAVAAYKHIRTKKILIGVGVTSSALIAGYAVYKIHDERVDKIIKSGTLLQNISPESNAGVRDAFYSSGNALDKIKYKGLYGSQLKAQGQEVFKKEVKVLSDIKQASPKNAEKILSDLIKSDPEFASGLKNRMTLNNNPLANSYVYAKKTALAEKSLSKGVVNKNVYEVFNASLVDHSPEMQKLTDRYYSELSKRGYNAIKDVNDSKYSGYKSIRPLITFDSNSKVKVVDVKKLVDEEITKSAGIAYATIIGSDLVKKGATTAGIVLGVKKLGKIADDKLNEKRVKKYRKKHSNTKLTNTEIIRMIERNSNNV